MRFERDRRGQGSVELALVLPILLLILMAIVDFGRMFHGYLAVTAAAREGARQAAIGALDSQVISTAISAAAPLSPADLTVTIAPETTTRYSGTPITVQVKYNLELLTPVLRPFLPNPYVVAGQAVMKKE